jgi:hypothetical protein
MGMKQKISLRDAAAPGRIFPASAWVLIRRQNRLSFFDFIENKSPNWVRFVTRIRTSSWPLIGVQGFGSSLHVPLLWTSMAEKPRSQQSLGSRWISRLPVPLKSSKITPPVRPAVLLQQGRDDGEPALFEISGGAKEALGPGRRTFESAPVEESAEYPNLESCDTW